MINENDLSDILIALDRQIPLQGGTSISLVVCGGTALFALGLASRTTRDIDVLGRYVKHAGPEAQLKSELPEGFEVRLARHRYGSYLTIYYISRYDQIHFKLYAAIDSGGYHVDDLFGLNPTVGEMQAATK